MPKKNWTEEERKAFGEKMRKARLDKETHSTYPSPSKESGGTEDNGFLSPVVTESPAPSQHDLGDVKELLKRIQELESAQWRNTQPVQVGAQGLTGTFEKYSTEKGKYPDPRERLADEQKLIRFAFKSNYDLSFEITESSYTTIDGIRTKEPKFILELIRVLFDEETGEPTNGRYIVCRFIMHEDPDAALVIARDNSIVVEEENEETFLNEMRYLRMRDWLLECFYPAPIQSNKNKKEVVIDGRMVEYYEVNNESGKGLTKTDWDKATKVKF